MKVFIAKISLWLLFLIFMAITPAWGGQGEDALDSFSIFPDEQSVALARSPRPASRIAENVTVITAEQIETLNAHTVADVLNTVPGIQFNQVQTPGSWSYFNVQGARSNHIQVLIDGVPQNNLADNAPDLGAISVHHIERIEIIKGAASAAWGQALGGVINIVTKSPEPDKVVTGTAFSSYGTHGTTDARGELSGSFKRLGYYLSGGNLHSGGLLENNQVNRNSAYGKITYELPDKGYLTLGFDYRHEKKGYSASAEYDLRDTSSTRFGYSFIDFVYPLRHKLTFELAARESYTYRDYFAHNYSGAPLDQYSYQNREKTLGTAAKVTWGDSMRNMVVGVEYMHDTVSQAVTLTPQDLDERVMNRYGVYGNGVYTIGKFTLLPGIRFDDTGMKSTLFSYTLGATYQLTDKTVLRCYGAKGYSLPNALMLQNPEQVWTVQVGAESSNVLYVWLKGTLFYNRLWDINDTYTRALRQGFELEARTVTLYGFSFGTGYTFTDARNTETNDRLKNVPVHSAKLSLNYDSRALGLRGMLTGNYVRWNGVDYYRSADSAILWDLSLTKKLPLGGYTPEVFFSIHNILDSSQYQAFFFKNTGRWLEGGVRFKF